MTVAFVLGNGVSRRGIPLNNLKENGTLYGCNALYRDFTPDVLVATDKPIATLIQESGYSAKNTFYTRRPLAHLGGKDIPKPYFGFSSGPVATALAANAGHNRIYMIGFDMGPSPSNQFNNIYSNSEFYKRSDSPPTYTGNWVKQITQICKEFKETKFIRVCGPTTARLPDLEKINNLDHVPTAYILDRINKLKDF
jgi:hypothetical protein